MNSQKKIKNNFDQNVEALEKEPASVSQVKPIVFHYHDYVQFLNDWIVFQKKIQKSFSLRQLAGKCQIATGYLPMVLSGQRPLSQDALSKLMPEMRLSKSEQLFFEAIHLLSTTSLQSVRTECLDQMRRYSAYREYYPNESEVYRYLTKWYYSTIRELSADPEFKPDAEWIQSRLRERVPLAELKEAVTFLVDNKYIIISDEGIVTPPEKHLSCEGGIYKVALTEYHRQLLSLSEKSIENASTNERHLIGHTFAVSEKKFERIQELLKEVVEKIQEITQEKSAEPRDTVYHLEMALFPLTISKEKK
ncbi:MAG: DUF4423 domain-containing protein [Bdellovibrionaceae bacterium]|nr:DUF4423 domain-containing protein [Pseudobdellovibrionaceae bacterium]